MRKSKEDSLIRSSTAEYLTYIAATGDNPEAIEVRYEDENIWLTQKMLATVYGVELNTINYHIKKIYEDKELTEDSTIRNFRIVQKEGNREVSRNIAHYNLQMIIAIGFKVDNEKAMLKPRKRNSLKEFYFSTNTSSMRVNQYKSNPNASIYFYHKGIIKYVGVMLKGKMEILTDQETKNMIWKKGDTIFYKKGVTDPDYCVLKFTVTSGRYYCDLKTENFDIK